MSRYNDNIYTIFDFMEKQGVFRRNPANRDAIADDRSSAYKGPVQFPKMLYHPKGETRITVPGEVLATPFGPKMVGEQREIINRLVETPKELAVLKQLGWHDHPAKAIAAGGGEAPPVASEDRVKTLEETIELLRAELEAAKSAPLASNVVAKSPEERAADLALAGEQLKAETDDEENEAAA